ncbi:MAG: Gfo/Idh/MocA family oxidoreductase [Caldilineaceae bacterium]|nr:Gfo/Idh/MocA family oxidoreductase [Caldilineaceae bacterium]
MDRIRIGVIGLRFGQQHVRTLVNMPDAHLVAVADRNPAVPGGLESYAASYGVSAYRDAAEMVEHESLDALCISTAPRSRHELIELGASKGLPMFVEKPWATNLAHARQLADLCRRTGATVMTAFSFRFHPAIVKLRELMDADLGAGWMLNGQYVFGYIPPAGHWLWDPADGNGFFNENSCHLFDAVCSLLGDPVSVMAEIINPMNAPTPNAAAVTVRFAGGAIAALTLGGIAAPAMRDFPRIDVITANGQATLVGREHIWVGLRWSTRGDDAVHQIDRQPEALGRTRYTDAFQHFFDCIRAGQPPSATARDGVRTVALAMALTESAHSGQPVQIPTF